MARTVASSDAGEGLLRHAWSRRCRLAAPVCVAVSLLLAIGEPASRAGAQLNGRHVAARTGGLETAARFALAPGVEHLVLRASAPALAAEVAHVRSDAPVRFEVVLSTDRVFGQLPELGLEPTSSMCRRAGGVVCVNGDFTACRACGEPLGGVVIGTEIVRSPDPFHDQLSLAAGQLHAGTLGIAGRVTASYDVEQPAEEGALGPLVPGSPPAQVVTEHRQLELSAFNVALGSDSMVLYSPWWSGSTHAPPGAVEMVVRAARPATIGAESPLEPVELRDGHGDTPIPADGYVVAATGTGAEQLRAFWTEFATKPALARRLVLGVAATLPVEHSLGIHPVVLRDGQVVLDPSDPIVESRHPRTLVGWNASGDRWLVTVDGRQRGHSAGLTLPEAAELLAGLGATDAVNLDGGGSTTFVAAGPCEDVAPCVRNRGSDGRERPVSTALAVVPLDPAAVAVVALDDGAEAVTAEPAPEAVPEPPAEPPATAAPVTVTTTTSPPVTTPAPRPVAGSSAAAAAPTPHRGAGGSNGGAKAALTTVWVLLAAVNAGAIHRLRRSRAPLPGTMR